MRPSSLRSSAEERPRVLVLGSGCIARRIVEDLASQGCQVRTLALPQTHSETATELKAKLREQLSLFGKGGPSRVWIHPGVTEWAWRADLISIAQEVGAGTVTPAARVVNLFSSRLNLFSEAEKLSIPHPAISLEPVQSEREVENLLGPKGYPAVLKSVSCHGEDSGIRVVSSAEELHRDLPVWLDQLRRTVGDGLLLVEKYIDGARALTLPFARFKDGSLFEAPIVDSSLMTRQKRMIEFCPAEKVDAASEEKIREAARKLLKSVDYVGVGSLEFLVDGSRIWLMGANPTIGTNYPLWERIGVVSAVNWQMATLLEESAPTEGAPANEKNGRHSIWTSGVLVRIHAEDPVLRIPQPGRVIERLPGGGSTHVLATAFSEARIDFCDWELTVPSESDGLVSMVWAGAKSRRQAVEYARTVLQGMWIAGGLQTNLRLQQEVLEHPWVREGVFHAGFLDEDFVPQLEPPLTIVNLFQKCAQFLRAEDGNAGIWTCGLSRLGPKNETATKISTALPWVEKPRTWRELSGATGYVGRLKKDAAPGSKSDFENVCLCPVGTGVWRAQIGPFSRLIRKTDAATVSRATLERPFYSQMAGRVHALLFREGRELEAGEPLIVIESLRQLVPLALPGRFRLKAWKVKADQEVAFGQILAIVEGVPPNARV